MLRDLIGGSLRKEGKDIFRYCKLGMLVTALFIVTCYINKSLWGGKCTYKIMQPLT